MLGPDRGQRASLERARPFPSPEVLCWGRIGAAETTMAIRHERITLEEFLRLPEERPALEYLDGKATQKVAPTGQHGWLQFGFAAFFNNHAVPMRLALAIPELRTTYAGASPVPDVAVYRWEHVPWSPDGEVPNYFYAPPDIAVEIVSPAQSKTGLRRKCARYVANGVTIALLVDPDTHTVWLYRHGEPPVTLRGAAVIDFAPVLPGLTLVVDQLFDWLRPGRAS